MGEESANRQPECVDGCEWKPLAEKYIKESTMKGYEFYQLQKDAATVAEAWDIGYGCACEPIKDAVILCQVCKAAERIRKGGGDE